MQRLTIISILTLCLLVTIAYAGKECPNCGRKYADEDNFCTECLPPTRLVSEGGGAALPSGMKLVSIPGGSFSMGSNMYDDEKPVHTVKISGFKLVATEVTVGQYCEFLNAKLPSESDRKEWIAIKGEDTGWGSGDDSHIYKSGSMYKVDSGWPSHPAVNVSWYGAKAFCDFYGLRLPTEAEWEYAAGSPNHYDYPWRDSFNSSKCCYVDNNGSGWPPTMAVKSFSKNGYGLYDMAGNVDDWCADWYDSDYYSNSPMSNPYNSTSASYRVVRGGNWRDGSDDARCANRSYVGPVCLVCIIGFRCARDWVV